MTNRGPWSWLEALEPFFAMPDDVPDSVRALLASLPDLEQLLWREQRQITFFGAFKAGKSSLLNALIGAALLPVRTNRATGVVTTIQYGAQPSAIAVRRCEEGQVEQQIPFDDVSRAILLDLSGGTVAAPSDIEEVRIQVPLPFLETPSDSYPVLVDTPGLLEHEALTQRRITAKEAVGA